MNQLREQISWYQKEKPEFKELLEFYSDILAIRQRHSNEITAQTQLADDQINTLIEQGEYLLAEHPIQIDEQRFEQIKNELKELLNNHESVLPETETESFLSFYATMPFYCQEAAYLREKIDFSEWLKGFCPVCGQLPRIGKLRKEDGKRLLKCPSCLTEWPFARIGCPSCNNTNSTSLNYFYAEADRSRRANICEECKTYVKTVDERLVEKEVVLEIEDIITQPLNKVVEEKGFQPLSRDPEKLS